MAARVLLPVLILLTLAGCGCGGGGGGTAVPPPSGGGPPTVPPAARCVPLHDGTCAPDEQIAARAKALAGGYSSHRGYRNQWGLDSINAGTAYGHLELLKGRSAGPGAGVTIGFIDSGIDTAHPAFAGKRVTERFLAGASDETGTDRFSHGTAVASVAAAVRSTSSIAAHGVAWDADVAMFAIPIGPGGGDYVPISLDGLGGGDDLWTAVSDEVLTWRDGSRKIDFLNLSVGYKGIIDNYSEQRIRTSLGGAIAAMAQDGVSDKTVFIWAAGNAHGDPCDDADLPQCVNGRVNAVSVELLPGLAARIRELRDHTLAVVALRPGDPGDGIAEGIADFSNRCGIAADYCIAAPGQRVRGAYFGPDRDASPGAAVRAYTDLAGTSVAAPMVTGGLALMKQLFRDQLSNTALVARLLDTADDRGRYSDRAVYGRGKMDLGAATSPVGILSVPATGAAAGPNTRLGSTRLYGPAPPWATASPGRWRARRSWRWTAWGRRSGSGWAVSRRPRQRRGWASGCGGCWRPRPCGKAPWPAPDSWRGTPARAAAAAPRGSGRAFWRRPRTPGAAISRWPGAPSPPPLPAGAASPRPRSPPGGHPRKRRPRGRR